MKLKYKKILSFFILSLFFSLASFNFVGAADPANFAETTGLNATASAGTGYNVARGGKADIANTVGKIAGIIISFIGVIFMVLILMGSFELTSAAGNEEQVKSGKQKIKNGAIGMLIVFGSYLLAKAITAFITNGVMKI